MKFTFVTRKFWNGQRNVHWDIVRITTKWVFGPTLERVFSSPFSMMLTAMITPNIGVRDGGQLPPPQFGQFADIHSGREVDIIRENPIHV